MYQKIDMRINKNVTLVRMEYKYSANVQIQKYICIQMFSAVLHRTLTLRYRRSLVNEQAAILFRLIGCIPRTLSSPLFFEPVAALFSLQNSHPTRDIIS